MTGLQWVMYHFSLILSSLLNMEIPHDSRAKRSQQNVPEIFSYKNVTKKPNKTFPKAKTLFTIEQFKEDRTLVDLGIFIQKSTTGNTRECLGIFGNIRERSDGNVLSGNHTWLGMER